MSVSPHAFSYHKVGARGQPLALVEYGWTLGEARAGVGSHWLFRYGPGGSAPSLANID